MLVSPRAVAWLVLVLSTMVATADAAAVSPSIVALGHRLADRLPFLVDTLDHEGSARGVEVEPVTARDCAAAKWDGVCGALPLDGARRIARRCRRLLSDADAALERAGSPAESMRGLAVTS